MVLALLVIEVALIAPQRLGSDVIYLLLSAVSEADSVVKVAEWQQTYYASDSGIQSGATTVRDDESSTEYSGHKKYTGSATTSTASAPATATAGGGGEMGAGALESPTGEVFGIQGFMCFGFPLFISLRLSFLLLYLQGVWGE